MKKEGTLLIVAKRQPERAQRIHVVFTKLVGRKGRLFIETRVSCEELVGKNFYVHMLFFF